MVTKMAERSLNGMPFANTRYPKVPKEPVVKKKPGRWEPCSALQCSECNGIVTTELNDLDHGDENEDGETEYECPHCGSENLF